MMSPTERFRSALARDGGVKDFHNIPVDWWDSRAGVWRPSILDARSDGFQSAFRSHVDILFPEPVLLASSAGCELRSVRIADLRPSRLLSDRILRFFSTRYALEVLEDLEPCIVSGHEADRTQLQSVARDLRKGYHESLSVWRDLFEQGSKGDTIDGTLCHVADDLEIMAALSRPGTYAGAALQIFRSELMAGEVSCSPVAWWDENSRTWRPTMLIGATGAPAQFMPTAKVRIVVPDAPFAIKEVCGADLKPLDIATAGFSLCALPVLIRDLLQMHRAMVAAGAGDCDVQFDPMLAAVAEMVTGAAREWGAQFTKGAPGDAPEPRVVALHPEFWGLTTTTENDIAAWWQQSSSPRE